MSNLGHEPRLLDETERAAEAEQTGAAGQAQQGGTADEQRKSDEKRALREQRNAFIADKVKEAVESLRAELAVGRKEHYNPILIRSLSQALTSAPQPRYITLPIYIKFGEEGRGLLEPVHKLLAAQQAPSLNNGAQTAGLAGHGTIDITVFAVEFGSRGKISRNQTRSCSSAAIRPKVETANQMTVSEVLALRKV
ncbi:hypothetical protein DFJ74DRAFT_640474 [Hyaloraphidium curvatum]|nr:hypothetical protein DFJ74DRAFT_640474 [Hyaloraphidium curvatum]